MGPTSEVAMSHMLNALRRLETKADSFEPISPAGEVWSDEDSSDALERPVVCPDAVEPHEPTFNTEPISPAARLDLKEAAPDETPNLVDDVEPVACEASLAEPAEEIAEPETAVLTPFEMEVRQALQSQPLAGQVRQAMEAILAEFPGPEPASLLVVGVDAGGHDALLAAALGALLAEHEQKDVVLIDANFAGRELTVGFGLADERGVACLLKNLDGSDLRAKPTSLGPLYVLPTGRESLITPRQMEKRLAPFLAEQVRERRFAIVHGGAPDAVLTRQFARICDGVYLIVRLSQTLESEAIEAAEAIRSADGRLLGCLVTNAPAK